ncbi:kinesin-like protein KIF18B isoform X2 [Patagioenas fasciata]|uniref:kinesin-like protein KIF18B isoform X2 n=1 Tax=Patagioenas fasciata TaxID=372321 RepID=UPI003A9956E3
MGVWGLAKRQAPPPLLHCPADPFSLPRVCEVSWTFEARVVFSRRCCVLVSPSAMALGSPPEEGTVSVVVRVRPPAPCERERAAHPVLHVVDDNLIVFNPDMPSGPPGSTLTTRAPKHPGKDVKFVFDRVFGEGATQDEVFQHTTRGLLDTVLNGYNCSVFAYGATGAGKTYTMVGSESSPGIMYLTMVGLYEKIEAMEERSCEVLVSYQEVYNEQIYDLLEPKGPLNIREDPDKGVIVQGLSFHQPSSAQHLLEMLAEGNKNRTQHPTDANATSSRSHAVFQICVKQQDRIGGLTRDLQVSKMSLIDLAGSERASVTNAKGERLREGANINRSLLALINVINALADTKSKKTHIPYRDSKLTRLLKDSIGGNCRTVMIAAVSPSALAYEDTYNTLKYASRAKEIKLSLKSNVLSVDCHISKYAVVCEQLQAEVADLRAKLRAYEDAAQEAKDLALVPPIDVSPAGLHRLEASVPKPHSALGGDSEQQELGAGWPAQLQLEPEEVPEEMLHSSTRTTHQLEPKEPSRLLQGLSGNWTEKLIAAILSVARKQYSLLRDANLLTPDMVSEFEELERLVRQDAGVALEQTSSLSRAADVTGASAAPSCDEVSVAVPNAPTTSVALQCLQQLSPLASPVPTTPSPIRKRRNTGRNSAAMHSAKRNNAEMHSFVLSSAEMHSAKRSSAEMHGSVLSSTEMHSAKRSSAEMHGSVLSSAGMHSAKRSSTEMHGSVLSSAEMHSAKRSSAEMYSTVSSAGMRSATRNAEMHDAMNSAEMHSAEMHNAMNGTELRSATNDAVMCSAEMHNAVLSPAEMSSAEMCSAEMHSPALNSTFQVETPRSLKRRVKRQRSSGSAAEIPGPMLSPGSPCLAAAAQAPLVSPLPSYYTPKICPLTVPKSRVPLAVSAAQNCHTVPAAPAHKLNVTFDVCEYSGVPGAADLAAFSGPEFSIWENVQSLLNKQDGPLMPRACVPAHSAKASSIPKPSLVPKAPAQKRRRVESTASPSLGGLQSHIANLPSTRQRRAQLSRIPAHPPAALPRKGKTRSTKDPVASARAPRTRTPQSRKLLC